MLAALVLAPMAAPAAAQIDRINHRQWTWLTERRGELLEALRERPAAIRAKVAAALTRSDEGVPLLTWARAMALAKGCEDDAGFRYRAGLQVIAMPEVVSSEVFDHVAVTVYAPHVQLSGDLPMPRKYRMDLQVLDAAGAVVYRGSIEESDDFSSLREFRVVHKVPTGKLEDGAYTVRVAAVLDGVAPRAHDLPLQATFHVLDGYKARAEVFRIVPDAMEFVRRADKFEAVPRAAVLGAAYGAARPYDGTPGVPAHAVRDLQRAEHILANLDAGRPPLAGLSGYVDFGLPAAHGELLFASARLPEKGLPAAGSAAWAQLARRPLVLVMGRLPSWDARDRRPSAPRFTLPGHLATQLEIARFDLAGSFQVLVVESPGRLRGVGEHLRAALDALPAVLPHDPDRLVLIGDGHGAAALAELAQAIPRRVAGLAMFNAAGGLATPGLKALRGVPILAVPGRGRLGRESIAMLGAYGARAGHPDLRVEPEDAWPWSIALPLASKELERFAHRATAPKRAK